MYATMLLRGAFFLSVLCYLVGGHLLVLPLAATLGAWMGRRGVGGVHTAKHLRDLQYPLRPS